MRNLEDECACRDAVSRSYRELRQCAVPERSAFEASIRVYLYYHPEVPTNVARLTVSAWLENGNSPET